MNKKLKTILLLDDNKATNFIHKKFISQADCTERTLDFQSGINALQYLNSATSQPPELIFVDINMPIMSAWEFLEEYEEIARKKAYDSTKLIVLSTSISPSDKAKTDGIDIVDGVRLKPLSVGSIQEVITEFFPDHA